MSVASSRANPIGPSTERGFEADSTAALKGLIWLYIVLLIFEGALRKWVFPGLSAPLLFVRDPIAIAIYAVAISEGRFPWNLGNIGLLGLAAICTLAGAIVNIAHPLVTIYGFKANFAHLPLIFVLGRVLKLPNVIAIGRFVLVIGIVMLPVVIQQFRTGPESWWNVGAGGVTGGQITAAMGKVRASGFFSFVSGIVQFCPLHAAFIIYGFVQPRTYNRLLLYTSTAALVLTLGISTSRAALGNVATVILMVGVIVLLNPRAAGRFGQAGALIGVIFFFVSGLDIFSQGKEVMTARLSATGDLEAGVAGASAAWSERVFGDLKHGIDALAYAPILGYGIGLGTNVGTQLVQGTFGYLLAEGEWPRIVLEMGPLFGFLYLVLRIGILVTLFSSSAKAAQRGNTLPLLLFGASAWMIFNGQYGQVTTVGFAALCAGLCFAAQNDFASPAAPEAQSGRSNIVRNRSKYAEYLYGTSDKSRK